MKKRLLALLIISVIFITNNSFHYTAVSNSTADYVIMFDESHGQFFNRTLMATAIESLEELASYTDDDISIEILFQTESDFNSTNLQGVDLLIFTNPGFNEDDNLSPTEIEVLLDYVELGGSLFLLCNPLTHDDNITGHPTSINDLLAGREDRLTSARVRATANATNADVILDDFQGTYGNDSFVSLDLTDINANYTIYRQEELVNTTTIYSSPLILGNEDAIVSVGRTPITSYTVNDEYDMFRDLVNGFLTWLIAKVYSNSRMILSGSTIMFSDLEITDGKKWIEQSDNLVLWRNIVLWLLKYTPHLERAPPEIWLFRNYALIVVVFSIVIFGSAFLIYQIKKKRKSSVKLK